MPDKIATCVLRMPALGTTTLLNEGTTMDIFNTMHAHVDKAKEFPERLICPAGETVPEDGVVQFVTVETLADVLVERPANTVIMFRDDQHDLVKCLIEYSALFGCEPVILSGVPSVTYSGEFDKITWSVQRLAYHTIVNDLLEVQRRNRDMQSEIKASSVGERERASFTRKDGSVKEFRAFSMPPSLGRGDDAVDVEGDNAE